MLELHELHERFINPTRLPRKCQVADFDSNKVQVKGRMEERGLGPRQPASATHRDAVVCRPCERFFHDRQRVLVPQPQQRNNNLFFDSLRINKQNTNTRQSRWKAKK